MAGIVVLVYPVVVEIEELEELDDSSFSAQPLKIISVNRTGIIVSFEIFIISFMREGYSSNLLAQFHKKLILSRHFIIIFYRLIWNRMG